MRIDARVVLLAIAIYLVSILKRSNLGQYLTAEPDDRPQPQPIITTHTIGGEEGGIYHFIHLYNPFRVENCEKLFCPYDRAQSLAIASMYRAQEKAQVHQNISVELAAITFGTDQSIIPKGFRALPPLNRSTATVYPNLSIQGVQRSLPFIQDMFSGLLQAKDSVQAEFVVYTNSDIILHEDFYVIARTKIDKGHTSFTVNRQIVLGYPNLTAKDLDVLFHLSSKDVLDHPGYDCFVFSYDILSKLDLGNVFLGYPPVGIAIVAQLMKHGGTSFRRFRSKEVQSTYHIGLDNIWRPKNGESEVSASSLASQHQAYNDLNKDNADALEISWREILGKYRPNRIRPDKGVGN